MSLSRKSQIAQGGISNARPGRRPTFGRVGCAAWVVIGIACSQACAANLDIQRPPGTREVTSAVPAMAESAFPATMVRLRLIDPNGAPVAGAKVGLDVRAREEILGGVLVWIPRWVADEDGEVLLVPRETFKWGPDRGVVFILHEERKLGAVQALTAVDAGKTIDVLLKPVCRVHGTLRSPGLPPGMPLHSTDAEVLWQDIPVLEYFSRQREFAFPLPPGEYTLSLRGYGYENKDDTGAAAPTRHETLPLQITAGAPDRDLGAVELRPTKLATLVGRPAPELGPIEAWRNGSPVTLAQLRGQVVILYFAGACPRVAGELTSLVELHGFFADRGLSIIAIYNCASMEELEQAWPTYDPKLARVEDVPFRVALDGGVPAADERTGEQPRGATYRTYGISGSAAVLIDHTGKVVGEYSYEYNKGVIHRLLDRRAGVPVPPSWRNRFDEVYRLEPGQILKRIAAPFGPERLDYCRNEPIARDEETAWPPTCLTWRWDDTGHKDCVGYARPLDLASVLEHVVGLNRSDYEGRSEVLSRQLPGDWIVRDGTPTDLRLQALEECVAEGTGHKVRFEKGTAVRQALVVTGRFTFYPACEETRVCVFAGPSWATNSEPGEVCSGQAGSTRDFVRQLGAMLRMPVVDRTENATGMLIPFYADLDEVLLRDGENAEKVRKLESLLANVAAQTGLHFEIRAEPTAIWHLVESD
jgi:hypothetical protein